MRTELQGLRWEGYTTSSYVGFAIKAHETPKGTPAEVEFTIINYKPP